MRTLTLSLLLLASGCRLGRHETVAVRVIDAETSEPIAKARIAAGPDYHRYWPLPELRGDESQTNAQGDAVVHAPLFKPGDGRKTRWLAWAQGYEPLDRQALPGEAIPPALRRGSSAEMSAIILLFRSPPAAVTFIVPESYRGLIQIKLNIPRMPVATPVGKRDFRYEIDASGRLEIDLPPVLIEAYRDRYDTTARFETASGHVLKLREDRADDLPTLRDYSMRRVSPAQFQITAIFASNDDLRAIPASTQSDHR